VRHHLDRILSGLLTVAALAIAASMIHREFLSPSTNTATTARPPRYVANWSEFVKSGVLIGDKGAPVKVIELMDLECPYCKTFHAATKNIRHKYGKSVAVAVVDFPLEGHRFARSAARALACANELGRFAEFLDAVYAGQDSLGSRAWQSFASEAQISDTAAFNKCASATASVAQVDAGLRLAKNIGAVGTPTVIVNGWQFYSPPDEDELDRVVASLIAGKQPFAKRGIWARLARN
jgi:protein-disulfide isomerase